MTGVTPTPTVAPGASVIITDTCLYSHKANDDPILDPGKPGQSMAHDFFGNTSTSATSTAATLVGGSTTCSTSDDASAYWTPVLYQNGVAITPLRNLIYWARLDGTSPIGRGAARRAGDDCRQRECQCTPVDQGHRLALRRPGDPGRVGRARQLCRDQGYRTPSHIPVLLERHHPQRRRPDQRGLPQGQADARRDTR